MQPAEPTVSVLREPTESRTSTLAARLRWILVVGLLCANAVWFTMELAAAVAAILFQRTRLITWRPQQTTNAE